MAQRHCFCRDFDPFFSYNNNGCTGAVTYANGLYADFTMQIKTNAVRNNKNIVLRNLCPQEVLNSPFQLHGISINICLRMLVF